MSYALWYPVSICSIFVLYPFCICYVHVPFCQRVPCQITLPVSGTVSTAVVVWWAPRPYVGSHLPVQQQTKTYSPFRSQLFAYAWPFDKFFIPLKFSQKLERKQTQLVLAKNWIFNIIWELAGGHSDLQCTGSRVDFQGFSNFQGR